ncbi:hypothetical protein Gotri_002359 [Gossypium trilobum]|uniref:Uncharacterized protein n=1 Tax=Gossypium trilobum TaxID=34281 RepID=A0A7J9F805_9ROSI|nr:hypothetical protein [Gossypium trilobum]
MDKILFTTQKTLDNSCKARILFSIKTKGINKTLLRDALFCESERG